MSYLRIINSGILQRLAESQLRKGRRGTVLDFISLLMNLNSIKKKKH
jgi:hypothetical protein